MAETLQEKQRKGEEPDFQAVKDAVDQLNMQKKLSDRRVDVEVQRVSRQFKEKAQKIRRDMELNIDAWQNWIKALALILPIIPPLLVGIVVFVGRMLREREGISRARLL